MGKLIYRKEFMSYSKRLLLLWGAFVVCLLFVAILTGWFGSFIADRNAFIFISTAMQNVCVFILPAYFTAYYITPFPATFLRLNVAPRVQQVLFVVVLMVVSMPAMNYVVSLNEAIDLPDSALEDWLKSTEAAARAVTAELLSSQSVGTLLISVLIVGVLTGLGEEMFFRGAQLRIFMARGINGHLAVWITAIIFSALHFQFYGFFPRMLLGVMFGYLAWKGGSLWLPVIGHALNNSLVVIFNFMSTGNPSLKFLETYGAVAPGEMPVVALLSLVVTYHVVFVWGKRLFVAPGNAAGGVD